MFLSVHLLGPVIFVHLLLVVLNVPSSKKSVLFASLNIQVLRSGRWRLGLLFVFTPQQPHEAVCSVLVR